MYPLFVAERSVHGRHGTVLILAAGSATSGTVGDTVVFHPPCMLLSLYHTVSPVSIIN